jgi:polar amino acid transport system substrate-binding protein
MKKPWLLRAACLCLPLVIAAGCRRESTEAPASAGSAAAPAPKVLRVGSDATFPPMEFVDESGALTGFDVALVHALGEEMKADLRVENVAWDGIFGALSNGTIDMVASSVTITPERQAAFLFSEPYYTAGQVLVVRSGDAATLATLDDLAGRKVGAQTGTTGYFALQEREKDFAAVSSYPTIPLAMIDLVNGAIDAVLTDKPVADYYASKDSRVAGKLTVVGDLVTSEQFGFVLRKDDAETKAAVDAALARLKANGTYDRIHAEWFGEAPTP